MTKRNLTPLCSFHASDWNNSGIPDACPMCENYALRGEVERLTTELVAHDVKATVHAAREKLEAARPYWLWRAMLETLAKQDCEIGCCAESGLCITEWCTPCAATQYLAEELVAEAK